MRDSVVFYRSFYEAIKDLPEEQFAACCRAIIEYGLDEIIIESPGIAKSIFMMAKPQIDANNKRYINGTKGGRPAKYNKEDVEASIKARNSTEYIRWRDAVYKRDNYSCVICGETNDINAHHKKGFIEFPELRYELSNGVTLCRKCHNHIHNSENLEITKNQNSITENKPKEKEKENVKVKKENSLSGVKEKTHFVPPTLENVMGYCQEHGYNVDAEYFIDFYESKGWMIGKNKMKDWKATVRNWARQEERKKSAKIEKKQNGFHNFTERDFDCDALVSELNGF